MKEYQSLVSELGPRARVCDMYTSSAAHHIGTYLKRSDTTSADWLHTTLCLYESGSAMTMCGGVIRSPVAGQSGPIPVPCWSRLPNRKLLATSFFLYQKWSSPTTVVGVGLTVFSGKDFLRRCFSGMGWWAKRVRQVWCADAAADESEWAFVTKCHNGVVTVRQYTGGDTRHDGNEYWWTLLLDT